MANPITQEIRETRRRLAEQFDNDIDRIVDDLQERERAPFQAGMAVEHDPRMPGVPSTKGLLDG